MSTYLSRAVFTFPVDWADQPEASIDYELGVVDLGWNARKYFGDEVDTVHGWRFTTYLSSAAEIAQFGAFFADLTGSIVGFWLPTPLAAFTVLVGLTSSTVKVTYTGLVDVWDAHSELHVWFTKSGASSFGAKVTNVVDNGDGTETITFGTSVVGSVDATWHAARLEYVRLAGNGYTLTALDEGTRAEAQIAVIELPREYVTAETGQSLVWLYRFWTLDGGARRDWYFTSFQEELTVQNSDSSPVLFPHTPARIQHGAITRTSDGARESCQLEAEFVNTNPMFNLIPINLGMFLFVEVRSTTLADTTEIRTLFTGRVIKPSLSGRTITAQCSGMRDIASGNVPGFMLQTRCNYKLFEPNTCRKSRTSFQKTVNIVSISDRTITVSSSGLDGIAAKWFAEGTIEIGENEEFERRTILSSTATDGLHRMVLVLNYRLNFATSSDSAVIIPGCSGSMTDCIAKFDNRVNFGGHGRTRSNLALAALSAPPTGTGKK